MLRNNFPNHTKITLVGHSSGAHIGLIHVVQQAEAKRKQQQQQQKIIMNNPPPYECYVSLSGPMNVSHHFDYEAARGVEELSPLQPVNGRTREALISNSPVMQIIMKQQQIQPELPIQNFLPRHMLFLHGIEDTTVPFTATAEAAYLIRSCGIHVDEIYVAKKGHEDVVVDLMYGEGTIVWNKVNTWLQQKKQDYYEKRTRNAY